MEKGKLCFAGLYTYEEYINSDFWVEEMRPKLLELKGKICEKCNISEEFCKALGLPKPIFNIHHIKYGFYMGQEHEHLDLIMVLCRRCHKKIHNIEG